MRNFCICLCVIVLLTTLSCPSQLSNPPIEFQITSESHNQHLPAIYENVVVWEDWRNGNADIYGCNLSTGEEFQITSELYDQEDPTLYDGTVVWIDIDEIRGYNLENKEVFSIDISTDWPKNPAIYGDIIIWEETNDNLGIYGYNRITDEKFYVSGQSSHDLHLIMNPYDQQNPVIFKDIIIWIDKRHGRNTLCGYNIENNEEFKIFPWATYFLFSFSQHTPALSGDVVIWTEFNGDAIYGYNLSTHEKFPIALSQISKCKKETKRKVAGSTAPAIYEDIVVWVDCRNGNEDLFAYNIATGEEFQITSNEKDQKSPAIYGNIVVWEDNRNGQWDIYGIDISELTPTGKNDTRMKLLFREYFIKLLVIGGLLLFAVLAGKNVYYIVKFYVLKKQNIFKKENLIKMTNSPKSTSSFLSLSFITLLTLFNYVIFRFNYYFFISPDDRILIVLKIWEGIIILILLTNIWRIFGPYTYVDDNQIIIFPRFPGKWKIYEKKSIEKSTFRIGKFNLHLENGKIVVIDLLKAHEDDQIFLLESMKDFLKESMRLE